MEQGTPSALDLAAQVLSLEQWQIEVLRGLLSAQVREVEEGCRVYVSSATYGTSRYHLIDRRYDGVQIEQIEVDEKWSKRVNLSTDELPAVIKTLLSWYLIAAGSGDDEPGDLDVHPF